MNQVFAGVIALLLALGIWANGKKSRKTPFASIREEAFSALKSQDSSLVQVTKTAKITHKINDKNQAVRYESPKSPRDKLIMKKKLSKLIISTPNDRLYAIEIASQWASKEALPFIRRGLKDSDSRVVIAAAAAISTRKGNKSPVKPTAQTIRPPRNVALMR